jgi:hypothetical protein
MLAWLVRAVRGGAKARDLCLATGEVMLDLLGVYVAVLVEPVKVNLTTHCIFHIIQDGHTDIRFSQHLNSMRSTCHM